VIDPGSPCGSRTGRPPPDLLLAGVGGSTVGAVCVVEAQSLFFARVD